MAKRIIILEDDKTLALIYKMFLDDLGYHDVEFFGNAEEALAFAEKSNPDIALVDISLSGEIQGVEAATILQSDFNIPTIYITGHTENDIVQEALQSNTYGYLIKPIDKDMLRIGIELALTKFKNEKESGIEKQVVDQIDIGILVSSQDGEFLFANESAKRLLSIPKKYKQKKISEFLFGEKFVLDGEFVKKIIGHEVEKLEFRRNDLNKNFLIKFIIKEDTDKKTNLIFSFVHDITDDKKNQSKQKFLDFSLRTIFDAAKEAIFIIDRDFSLVDFNETATLYSDEQWGTRLVKGKDIFKTFPTLKKNEVKEFKKLFNNSFEGISHYLDRTFELQGKNKYFKINVFPIFSGSKNNVSLVGVSWYDNTYE
ncbi:MAG: response regulator, partial [Bacteroidales bacterium]|nr:response regulator [Bacteroidales bacterium]